MLDGHTADWVIVVARSEEGVRSFLLESTARRPVEPVPTLDPTRKAARLVLDETPVEPLGPPGNQAAIWRRVLDDVAVGLAAETVGAPTGPWRGDRLFVGAHRVRPARGHVPGAPPDRRHVPAGRDGPGGFQFAAWASDTEASGRERAAAMAASYASEAGVKVTGDDIQLHGGVGFTWANDAHFLFKRAKQNEILLGGAAHERHAWSMSSSRLAGPPARRCRTTARRP